MALRLEHCMLGSVVYLNRTGNPSFPLVYSILYTASQACKNLMLSKVWLLIFWLLWCWYPKVSLQNHPSVLVYLRLICYFYQLLLRFTCKITLSIFVCVYIFKILLSNCDFFCHFTIIAWLIASMDSRSLLL